MSEPRANLLSPVQRRIIAAGGTALAAVLLVVTALLLFLVLKQFVTTFRNVLLPLAIAAILATLLRPVIHFFEARSRLNRVQGIILLYLLVLLALGVAGVLVIPLLLDQIMEFIRHAPEIRANVMRAFERTFPAVWDWLGEQLGESPQAYIGKMLADNAGALRSALDHAGDNMRTLGGFVGGFFGTVAAYSIIPVYLFFILNGRRDVWRDLRAQLDFLPPGRRDDIVFLAHQFSDILTSFFRGQIIIGLLLGVVLAAGFSIVGLKFAVLLGFLLGLLNIIPYLGTMIGLVTVLPLAYFQEGGGLSLIGLCAAVFMVGQLLTDYVFTPKIMGDKTGMSPMLLIFSVFFWGTALNGILGMVLAIPLTGFFLVFWRLARDKYLPALTARQPGQTTPPSGDQPA